MLVSDFFLFDDDLFHTYPEDVANSTVCRHGLTLLCRHGLGSQKGWRFSGCYGPEARENGSERCLLAELNLVSHVSTRRNDTGVGTYLVSSLGWLRSFVPRFDGDFLG